MTGDLIERQAAIDEIEYEIEMINSALDSITLDFNARERLRQRRGEAREILNSIQQLPSAQQGGMSMGVYIKGMEMPKRCVDCWIMDGDDCLCCACRGRYLSPDYRYGIKDKPEWCPLVSVAEHGEMEEVPSTQLETCDYWDSESNYCALNKPAAQPTHGDGSNALDALDCVAQLTGKWKNSTPWTDTLECSECGWNIINEEFITPYCPNCGAYMRGEDDETD